VAILDNTANTVIYLNGDAIGGSVTDLIVLNTFQRTTTSTAVSYQTTGTEFRIAVTDTSATRTITISSSDIAVAGREFEVKDESGAAGTIAIVVTTESSQTIDGASQILISVDYGILKLYSDGSNLFTR
jgi:hypothetical protein